MSARADAGRARPDDQPRAGGTLVLVTHQVNITALTGIVPARGEMIVLSPQPGGAAKVVGRLGPAEFLGN